MKLQASESMAEQVKEAIEFEASISRLHIKLPLGSVACLDKRGFTICFSSYIIGAPNEEEMLDQIADEIEQRISEGKEKLYGEEELWRLLSNSK